MVPCYHSNLVVVVAVAGIVQTEHLRGISI